MPKELPGFYFDAEKNRYFPIKGPIPGASSSSSKSAAAQKPHSETAQPASLSRRSSAKTVKLLHHRELNGNLFPVDGASCSFEEEVHKIQASRPVVWRYTGTENICNCALEQMQIDVQTPEGLRETDALVAGGITGSLSLLQVGNLGQHFDNGVTYTPDRVWPKAILDRAETCKAHQHVWRRPGGSIHALSRISSINSFGKLITNDGASRPQHALITTLGSETSGGYVYVLNLIEPVDFASTMDQRIHVVAPFKCTIWAADYDNNKNQAVIGTNLGAALVNLVSGRASWVCHGKSDVLSLQFDRSGNIVLCGLRNGTIVTVDVREKQGGISTRFIKHQIPYSSQKGGQNNGKKWFELKGRIYPSCTIYMPSSVSSLVSLQLYEQYFLASSMDGSMKLYDHRLVKRGPVQSYEGHVNSHTRIQLGVDQSERFVMSGGEDCYLRLWSIKSGEMLFSEKFSSSVPSTVCWRRAERCMGIKDARQMYEEQPSVQKDCWGAWLGSSEGLFHVSWS